MDRHSVSWRGYIPAITTPFSHDESLDLAALDRLLDWIVGEGMHGVVALGTQGEWFSLSASERELVLAAVGGKLKGQFPIIAGCSAYTAAGVIENIRQAHRLGFDGALVTPPPYVMLSEVETFEFYREVDGATDVPLCVYNWPPGTNVDMSVELVERLADLPSVVAVKNSTPDLRKAMSTYFKVRDRIRVFGFSTNELTIAISRCYGVDGLIGAGGVLGRDHPGFFNAIDAGDFALAHRLGQQDVLLMERWFRPDFTGRFGSAQAILKEALNQLGLPGGYPRRPLLPLNDAGKRLVRDSLRELGKL